MHYFEWTANMTYKNHAVFRKWIQLINTEHSSAFLNDEYTRVAKSSTMQNIDIQLQLEEWSANKFQVSCLRSNKTVQEMSIRVAWPSKVMNAQQLPVKLLYLRIHLKLFIKGKIFTRKTCSYGNRNARCTLGNLITVKLEQPVSAWRREGCRETLLWPFRT